MTGTRRSRPGRPTAHAIRMGTCPSSSAAACGSWRRHRRSPSGTAGTWCTVHSSTCSADRDAARNVKPACLATQKTGLPRQWSECGGAHLIGVREARVDRRRLRPVGDERLLDGCHVILVAHGARGGCGNPETGRSDVGSRAAICTPPREASAVGTFGPPLLLSIPGSSHPVAPGHPSWLGGHRQCA